MQLCFDFDRVAVTPVILPQPVPANPRQARGKTAYYAGVLADAGYLCCHRYRDLGNGQVLCLPEDGE